MRPAARVLVIEPRRVACRSLAARVADLEGTRLGDAVGYVVRDDTTMSDATRIVFATPGIVLRQPDAARGAGDGHPRRVPRAHARRRPAARAAGSAANQRPRGHVGDARRRSRRASTSAACTSPPRAARSRSTSATSGAAMRFPMPPSCRRACAPRRSRRPRAIPATCSCFLPGKGGDRGLPARARGRRRSRSFRSTAASRSTSSGARSIDARGAR